MMNLENGTFEKAYKEAQLIQEQLDRLSESLIDDPDITLKEIQNFAKDSNNFSIEEQEHMGEIREDLEKKLALILSQVENPKNIQKRRKSLKHINNWIPMR